MVLYSAYPDILGRDEGYLSNLQFVALIRGTEGRAVTKVAVVEDDTQIRHMLEIAVQYIGLEVVSAGDGKRGLDVILRERPKVAILDVMMPGMSGLELCHAVKQLMGARAPYVIMLTAKGQPTDITTGRAHGADLYLIKPVEMAKLLDHIQAVVGAEATSTQSS